MTCISDPQQETCSNRRTSGNHCAQRTHVVATLADQLIFNTGEPAYAVDPRGTIIGWNRGAEAEFGHCRQDALGRRCWELLCGEDVFGNRYCCAQCPHREMARRGDAIRPSLIRLLNAAGQRKDYTVRTLTVGGLSDRFTLIHLCRPETAPVSRGAPSLAQRSGRKRLLTPREQQVLECLAEGLSTRKVASMLGVSPSTVRNHVEHLLAKLNAHSRLEAVATARRWGLV